MSSRPAGASDAAMVLAMASTAMPFADSPAAEAERWLRIMRLHGRAGNALQALGVSESPLERTPAAGGVGGDREPDGARDVIAEVSEQAERIAAGRGSQTPGTADVLLAVMSVYGEDFDRVLRVHGTDRDEVLDRLGLAAPPVAGD